MLGTRMWWIRKYMLGAGKRQKGVIKNFERPYRLHIGCGKIALKGWINIDESELSSADLVWDVTQGLPFEANSCRLIYCEHFLEHVAIKRAAFFLKECRRVLKREGVMRIAMPDLEQLARKYFSDDWKEQDWLKWPEHKFIQTRAEMINIAFRWWGHQWLYDREELLRRLHEAGFQEVRFVVRNESEVLELRRLETRVDSSLICEVHKYA